MLGILSARRKLLVGGLLAAVAAAFVYFVLTPQVKALALAKGDLALQTQKLAQARDAVSSLKNERELLVKVKEECAVQGKAFDTEMGSGTDIIMLGLSAAFKNIEITGVEPGKIMENGHTLEIPVKISLTGDYLDLIDFCRELEKSVKDLNELNLAEIRSLKIEAIEPGYGVSSFIPNSGTASPGQVKATLGLVIFSAREPEGKVEMEELANWLEGRPNVFSPAGFSAPDPEPADIPVVDEGTGNYVGETTVPVELTKNMLPGAGPAEH